MHISILFNYGNRSKMAHWDKYLLSDDIPSNMTYSARSVSPNKRKVLYLDSTEGAYCIGQMRKAVSQATLANYR